MKAEWLVVKYIPDLRRREPINVGVILSVDGQFMFRFLGQRPDGEINGRRIKWAGSVRNYKAWVAYWKKTLAASNGGGLAELLAPVPDANYSVEYAGERLLGTSDLDPPSFLDKLFSILVEAEAERTNLTVEQLSESLFNQVGIAERVQRGASFEVARSTGIVDSLYFDYRYDNGAVNLMQRVALIHDDERSWDFAHAAAWAFDQAAGYVHLPEGRSKTLVALVKIRPPDADLRRQLGVLNETAHAVVNVGEQDQAARELAELLGVENSPRIL